MRYLLVMPRYIDKIGEHDNYAGVRDVINILDMVRPMK